MKALYAKIRSFGFVQEPVSIPDTFSKLVKNRAHLFSLLLCLSGYMAQGELERNSCGEGVAGRPSNS